jgi:anti-anti-sigma regulatory factor
VGDLLQRLASGEVLVVDLSGVDHLGPVGVFVLESLSRRARAAGVELRVVAAPGPYRDVLMHAELSSET